MSLIEILVCFSSVCFSFKGTGIESAGVEAISKALKRNTSLANLRLSGHDFSFVSGMMVYEVEKRTGNRICDAGACSIGELLTVNTTLTELGVSSVFFL